MDLSIFVKYCKQMFGAISPIYYSEKRFIVKIGSYTATLAFKIICSYNDRMNRVNTRRNIKTARNFPVMEL